MAAAGEWYAAAKPTYTALVDPTHLVTELYHLVNVPSGIWVDEEGKVVRINEGAYTGFRQIGSSTPDYLPLVRDWAVNGAKSPYIWSTQEMAKRIRKPNSDEALADPTFKLGVYFFERDEALARKYWEKAQALAPTTGTTTGRTGSASKVWQVRSSAPSAARSATSRTMLQSKNEI